MSSPFTALAKRYPSPQKVQSFLRTLKYNYEKDGPTVRSAKLVHRAKEAHCLEAAILAAAILEEQGYPPLLLSFDSSDRIGHSIFVFKTKTGWGAVGRSKIPGLHGRAPRFRSIRDLVWSYVDPFVDATGSVTGYALIDLNESGIDWRLSERNVHRLETFIVNYRHQKIRPSKENKQILKKRFLEKGPIPTGKFWW